MDEDEFVLVISTLLHDIGKVRQRHEMKKTHAELGYEMAREISNLPYRERVANLIRFHHSSDLSSTGLTEKDIALLSHLKKADQLSASHDREDIDKNDKSVKDSRLEKIFKLVNYGDSKNSESKNYFQLMTLDKYLNNPLDYIENKSYGEGYEYIDAKLLKDLNEIHFNNDKIDFINTIISVLEKDLSFVPSAYFYSKGDISLFHHLKLSAAIAQSLWRSGDLIDRKMVILGGNLSGIQDYIFRHYVSDVADDRATRRLKGRSLIVSLFTDSVISYLLNEFDLTWANVIFNKSDGFAIIMNEMDEAKINQARRNIEKEFSDKGRDVYISISYVTISSDDLDPDSGKDFGQIMNWLQNNINERKSKIMSDAAENIFLIKKREDKKLCDYCGLDYGELDENNSSKCKMCRKEEDVGRWISKFSDSIYQTIRKDEIISDEENSIIFRYGNIAVKYSLENGSNGIKIKINPKADQNDQAGRWRILLVGKSVPFENKFTIKSINSMLCPEEKKESKNTRKCVNLGILKMDMDNMGIILTSGIQRRTISVYSSFIYFTSLFFASILENLAEQNDMYIVYSGGDDLVLLGRDVDVIDFSEKIHNYFEKYFSNPLITISGGIGVFEPKFPIRRGVEIAEEELKKSKGNIEKNSITLAENTMKWEEFKKMKKKSIELIYDNIDNKKFGKNFPYYLMKVQEYSIDNPGKVKRGRFYNVPDPLISYYVARNYESINKSERSKIEIEKIISELTDKDFLKNIKFISFYSILKMRYEEILRSGKNV